MIVNKKSVYLRAKKIYQNLIRLRHKFFGCLGPYLGENGYIDNKSDPFKISIIQIPKIQSVNTIEYL